MIEKEQIWNDMVSEPEFSRLARTCGKRNEMEFLSDLKKELYDFVTDERFDDNDRVNIRVFIYNAHCTEVKSCEIKEHLSRIGSSSNPSVMLQEFALVIDRIDALLEHYVKGSNEALSELIGLYIDERDVFDKCTDIDSTIFYAVNYRKHTFSDAKASHEDPLFIACNSPLTVFARVPSKMLKELYSRVSLVKFLELTNGRIQQLIYPNEIPFKMLERLYDISPKALHRIKEMKGTKEEISAAITGIINEVEVAKYKAIYVVAVEYGICKKTNILGDEKNISPDINTDILKFKNGDNKDAASKITSFVRLPVESQKLLDEGGKALWQVNAALMLTCKEFAEAARKAEKIAISEIGKREGDIPVPLVSKVTGAEKSVISSQRMARG